MTGFAAHQAEGLGFACRYGEENRFKDSLGHPSGRDGEGRLRAVSKRDWGVARRWEGDLERRGPFGKDEPGLGR